MKNEKWKMFCPLPLPFSRILRYVGKQPCGDGWFWLGANNSIHKFSVLENEHGRNTLNLKLSGRPRILIYIQLCDAIAAIRLGSQLLHDWTNHATGSTPGSPGVEQDWGATAFEHFALKRGVSHYQRFRSVSSSRCLAQIQRPTTLATLRNLFSGLARVDAIPGSTVTTSYYQHLFILLEFSRDSCIVHQKFRETISPATSLKRNCAGSGFRPVDALVVT
jgi:hypothetical protein